MKCFSILYYFLCCRNKYRSSLCVIIISLACLACVSSAKAQEVTLKVQNAELKKVLKQIRSQINYDFITTEEVLKKAKPVTLSVNKMDIKSVLVLITQGTPLKYEIIRKTIVITVKQ